MVCIRERRERAEKKALILIGKYNKMGIAKRLQYLKEHRAEYKRDRNIINRYYNLLAREEGFAGGIENARRELNENMCVCGHKRNRHCEVYDFRYKSNKRLSDCWDCKCSMFIQMKGGDKDVI